MPTWILKLSSRKRPSAGKPLLSRQCELTCGRRRPAARSTRQRRSMAARQPLLTRSFLGDQLIGHVEGLLRTTGRADVKAVLAVDDHRWHAADLVRHAQTLGGL